VGLGITWKKKEEGAKLLEDQRPLRHVEDKSRLRGKEAKKVNIERSRGQLPISSGSSD